MFSIGRLLLTTDLSSASERAFPVAAALARRLGARITVVHVLDDGSQLPPGALALSAQATQQVRKEVRGAVEKRLLELVNTHLSEVSQVDTAILEGHGAARLICEHARADHCELIVISTRGRSALSRALIGSTAERIARAAPCPVLSVPGV